MIDFGKILSLLARITVFSVLMAFLGSMIYSLSLLIFPFIDAFYLIFTILGYHAGIMGVFLTSFFGSLFVSVFVFLRKFIA